MKAKIIYWPERFYLAAALVLRNQISLRLEEFPFVFKETGYLVKAVRILIKEISFQNNDALTMSWSFKGEVTQVQLDHFDWTHIKSPLLHYEDGLNNFPRFLEGSLERTEISRIETARTGSLSFKQSPPIWHREPENGILVKKPELLSIINSLLRRETFSMIISEGFVFHGQKIMAAQARVDRLVVIEKKMPDFIAAGELLALTNEKSQQAPISPADTLFNLPNRLYFTGRLMHKKSEISIVIGDKSH